MNCIILISPGELLTHAHFIREMGYEIDLYPSTQDTSSLMDSRYEESAAYIRRSPESSERAHVRSLRASYMRMITDTRYADNDELIFCESDVLPYIHADTLRPIIQEALKSHPEADVIRLFYNMVCCTEAEGKDFSQEKISFSPMELYPHCDKNEPHVWGMHALIIPARSRAKLAKLFAEYRLPIDITLEAAHGKGELKVYSCSHDLFAQCKRSGESQPNKMALLLSSYKRYSDLQRQIWCMMDQDYQHTYHLYVAAKGMSEPFFQEYLYPQFKHFVDEGRLTLRHYPNKNQLSNLLDTIRDLDVSPYDLFVKIDDDDIYSRQYLRALNDYHEHLPRGIGSYFRGRGSFLQNVAGFPRFDRGTYWCYGSTMAFSAQILDHLRRYEERPYEFFIETEGGRRATFGEGFGFTEDALLDEINQFFYACNRASYQETKGYSDAVCVSQMNNSVTRGHYVAPDFGQINAVINTNAENHEVILEAHHPHWSGLLRILGHRVTHLNTGCEADILNYSDDMIRLKWDQWGEETFQRDQNGMFRLHENPSTKQK